MSEIDLQSTVTMTQGWEPNVQMQAQVLGTLQSKYDSNHKQLSNLYGSLLNSPLSRSENVAAREEFFKSISGDIQKIAGMDLSLQSNVSAASKVFQSIYTNKPLVKDMVWTRNFNDQLARAESFRNCADAEKCGGQYWEEGEKYLQYKKQEFATASRDEAMNFQDPKYIPYNNFMEKAIEQANKAGLSISKDVVTGGYKVTTKNGEQLTPHLSSLFTQMFEDNPKFHDMFKVQAYNGRKDWITQQIASGTFKDEGEAMVGYVQQTADATNKRVSHLITDIDNDAAKLEERYNDLSEKYNNKTITPSEMVRLEELHKERENIGQAKSYADVLRATQKNMNNTQNIRVIADMLDDQQAALLFQDDVTKAATTLAYKDHEVTMAEDKFALAQQQFGFDVQLEQIKAANAKDLVSWKAENGAYGSETKGPDLFAAYTDYQTSAGSVMETQVFRDEFVKGLIKDYGVKGTNQGVVLEEINKAGGISNWLASDKPDQGMKSNYKALYTELYNKQQNLIDVRNKKAVAYIRKGGMEDVTINFDKLSPELQTELLNSDEYALYMANR